jgi:threonine synthase
MNVSSLRCLRCHGEFDWDGEAYLCPRCPEGASVGDAGILDVQYDYKAAREQLFANGGLASERRDVFRYLPVLPLEQPAELLPAGGTPLFGVRTFAQQYGLAAVLLKDETREPTRALKDRATTIATARARKLGHTDIYCASAGNAAISMAAFAANTGMRAHAFVPSDASEVRLGWLTRLGADVRRSSGDYDQAFAEAESMRERGWYSRNCAFNPVLVEGKKTVAYEIVEQLGWRAPDLLICPVGDACTLSAAGKGFRELAAMGITETLPRLVGVQAAAVSPVVSSFRGVTLAPRPDEQAEAETAAASIKVKRPRNLRRLLSELEQSAGVMIAVGDGAIRRAQQQLAGEAGVIAEFTSAAALAGLERLAEHESLAGRTAVLLITGGRPDD